MQLFKDNSLFILICILVIINVINMFIIAYVTSVITKDDYEPHLSKHLIKLNYSSLAMNILITILGATLSYYLKPSKNAGSSSKYGITVEPQPKYNHQQQPLPPPPPESSFVKSLDPISGVNMYPSRDSYMSTTTSFEKPLVTRERDEMMY